VPFCPTPQISVCIPTYNGYPYVKQLIDELLRSKRTDFEIVVSDDCSSDDTWAYVCAKRETDDRLKCFRNEENLGMDRNFARAAELTIGRYVWMTGQDDRIFHEGLDAVADLLVDNPDLDFIHLNYTRVEEGGELPDAELRPEAGSAHRFGSGLHSFLERTGAWLPTFLPLFIMRKSRWSSVDAARYFGTCFCQVGVFLEVSEDLRWCHMDGNYVVGLTPRNGWQFKPASYARIVFGNYIMLVRAAQHCDWLGEDFLDTQFRKIWNQLVYAIILVRAYRLHIDDGLLQELQASLQAVPIVSISARLLFCMPSTVARLAMALIRLRRWLRCFVVSTTRAPVATSVGGDAR